MRSAGRIIDYRRKEGNATSALAVEAYLRIPSQGTPRCSRNIQPSRRHVLLECSSIMLDDDDIKKKKRRNEQK